MYYDYEKPLPRIKIKNSRRNVLRIGKATEMY